MQRVYAPLLKPLGLTYVGYLALLVLRQRDDQTVGEIGRHLYLDSGTLTPVLRRLERLGFVTRKRADDDEREVRVALTGLGRELEAALATVRTEVGCRMALDARAFAELRSELQVLRARLAPPKRKA